MGHGLGKGRGDMKKRNPAADYAMIVAGTFLIGFAIKNIYDPVSMVTGGVSGVAIIAKELWSVPLWLTNTVLNIPLFAAGFFFCGWRFIKRTLFATVMLSVSLYVLPEASYLGNDLFLSALFGGIISGVGTGLVFLTSCTTGGTDLLAALIQKRLKHYTLCLLYTSMWQWEQIRFHLIFSRISALLPGSHRWRRTRWKALPWLMCTGQ